MQSQPVDYKQTISWVNTFAVTSYRLVAGGYYFHLLSGHKRNMWAYIQNSVAHATALYWCHLFLDRDDDHYYKKFFNRPEIRALGKQFEAETVKARLLQAIKYSDEDFVKFHGEMKIFRDKWVAHMDLKDPEQELKFPNLTDCRVMGEELRIVLAEVCQEASKQKLHDDFYGWADHFAKYNATYIEKEANDLWGDREKYI